MDKKIWFKNKTYGWGWTPASVEGWMTIAIYVLIAAGYPFLAKFGIIDFSILSFFLNLIVSTLALLYVCYRKGEKPEWRWGIKK